MDSGHGLTVRTVARNGVAHTSLDGEMDISTVHVLDRHLAPVASDGVGTIVLDLRELAFTDTTGIYAFLAARNRVTDSGRRLILVGATPVVRRVFDLTGTLDLLDDRDAADVVGRFTERSGHMEAQATPADRHA